MNLAIFLTLQNLGQIDQWCKAASELQHDEVNGAVVIIHHNAINPQTVADVTEVITRKFKVRAAFPVSVNSSISNDAAIAAMFARFLLGCYSSYPGPWLIVEDNSLPIHDNFMQLALRQHNARSGVLTGRFIKGRGALAPVGPVVLSIPAKTLKFLRFPSGESWRRRGQFQFARLATTQIEDEDYLFQIPGALQDLTPAPEPVAPPKITRESIPLPAGLALPSQAQVAPVIDVETIEDKIEQELVSVSDDAQEAAFEETNKLIGIDGTLQTLATKKDLLDQVEKLTGTRPHHFTSEAKLQEILKSFDEA